MSKVLSIDLACSTGNVGVCLLQKVGHAAARVGSSQLANWA